MVYTNDIMGPREWMDNQWGPHMPKSPGLSLRIYVDAKSPNRDYMMTEMAPTLMKLFQTVTTPSLGQTGGHRVLIFRFHTKEATALAMRRYLLAKGTYDILKGTKLWIIRHFK